ncbi:MAG: TIM barrel protein [Candidatus Staskawiczbacteria bacterium]|jgi:deoxyribonuclease-4
MLNRKNSIKYGLKIWSTDKEELFKEAAQLFCNKEIDFVELYIVPDSLLPGKADVLSYLRNVPTTIHAPHSAHDFDVFKLDASKVKFFKNQIVKTADLLASKFIVLHAEAGDSQELFRKNIEKIKDSRILIENMTKIGINNEIHFGYSCSQLKFIRDCGFSLCLDFSHAIKSAISQNLNYKEFVKELVSELDPSYFHICNGKIDNEIDEHRDLFDGEFDLKWIKETLLRSGEKKDIYLVFETPKEENGLGNDLQNMNYFRSI